MTHCLHFIWEWSFSNSRSYLLHSRGNEAGGLLFQLDLAQEAQLHSVFQDAVAAHSRSCSCKHGNSGNPTLQAVESATSKVSEPVSRCIQSKGKLKLRIFAKKKKKNVRLRLERATRALPTSFTPITSKPCRATARPAGEIWPNFKQAISFWFNLWSFQMLKNDEKIWRNMQKCEFPTPARRMGSTSFGKIWILKPGAVAVL